MDKVDLLIEKCNNCNLSIISTDLVKNRAFARKANGFKISLLFNNSMWVCERYDLAPSNFIVEKYESIC